jgi:tetratricopeptide (TPR) repeat protein
MAAIRDELSRLTAAPAVSPIIALVGERRVGKTSILHRIDEFAIDHHLLPCRINVVVTLATDPWEFWHETLQAILSSAYRAGILSSDDGFGFQPARSNTPKQAYPIPPLAFAGFYAERPPIGGPAMPPSAVLNNDLGALHDVISRSGYHGILLMFDEAHFLRDSQPITQQLRYITRAIPGIALIFCGENSLNEMFTDHSAAFYAQARIVPIRNFMSKADVAECVLLPLTEEERPLVSPMTVDHLFRLSHGKPNQIRMLCYHIYQRYQNQGQDDLNISIGTLDDVLETIQAQYASEPDLTQRVDAIRRLSSVDLEVLYLSTRYPHWNVEDIVMLDEAFRGERQSPRAAARRREQLSAKHAKFVAMGLLENRSDRHVLIGGEFVNLYLRFWYEVRKYGELHQRINLIEGPPTSFGEKVEKLIRSLAWDVRRSVELTTITLTSEDSPREQAIAMVHERFQALSDLMEKGSTTIPGRERSLAACYTICQMIGHPGLYCVLVIAVRNLDDPREAILAEVYFEGGDVIELPYNLIGEQAEAARVRLEAFDAWAVFIPSFEALVRVSTGREFEDILGKLGVVEQWMFRAVRRLVLRTDEERGTQGDAAPASGNKDYIELYRLGEMGTAIDTINEQLRRVKKRVDEARLYNDRGYIRYGLSDESERELAIQDSRSALELHHRSLGITLLNLAVAAIDARDLDAAVGLINNALLITLGRETLGASFLRLRLLPGNLLMTRREKWEQHPANVLEAAYVNLAYAVALKNGYAAAEEVLAEGRELLPTSVRLAHALARLHLWRQRAVQADPLYAELVSVETGDAELNREVALYRRAGRAGHGRR